MRDRTRLTKKQRKERAKFIKSKKLEAASNALLYGATDGRLYLDYGIRKRQAMSMRCTLGVKYCHD